MTMVEGIVGNVIPVALRNLVTLAGALTWMVFISPNLTGLVLLLIPVLLTPLFLIGRRMQKLSVRAQDRFADAIGQAGESLGALDTVQAFGQEEEVSSHFNRSVEAAFAASRSQLRARGLLSGLMITLIFGGMGLLLFQSAVAEAIDHSLSAGALFQLLALAFFAANAVKDLSEVWGQIQKASGASLRISEMLDAIPAIAAPARPRSGSRMCASPTPGGRGRRRFRDFPCMCGPVSASPWWDRPEPARARSFACCCASMILTRGPCAWTAWT
jgi:ATP-binding cassette subfamily B protein